MSEELFDVVNERDEVIGRAPRQEVHRLGLKHRAVHVLVFNGSGKVFLQKRSMKKDTFPGAWDSSASGHLESGEDYDACARRELIEEIGLKQPEDLVRRFKINACAGTGQEFVWVYSCRWDGSLELNPDEIERGGWFEAAEVDKLLSGNTVPAAESFRLIWRVWKEGKYEDAQP